MLLRHWFYWQCGGFGCATAFKPHYPYRQLPAVFSDGILHAVPTRINQKAIFMKTIPLRGAALLVWAFTVPSVSADTVYECKDGSGRTVYVQNAGKHCRKADIGRIGIYSNTPAPGMEHAPHTEQPEHEPDAPPSADNRPKRQAAQQQLDDAKKALAEGRQVRYGNERNYVRYQERIRRLENAVHEAQTRLNELNRTPEK